MSEAILIACITAAASVLCQVLISRRTSSLMAYRIEQLEKTVGKHNNLIERTHNLELALTAVENRAKSNSHRLDNLEG